MTSRPFRFDSWQRADLSRALPRNAPPLFYAQVIGDNESQTITRPMIDEVIDRLEFAGTVFQGARDGAKIEPPAATRTRLEEEAQILRAALAIVVESHQSSRDAYLRGLYSENLARGEDFEAFACRMVVEGKISWWPVKREFSRTYLQALIDEREPGGEEAGRRSARNRFSRLSP